MTTVDMKYDTPTIEAVQQQRATSSSCSFVPAAFMRAVTPKARSPTTVNPVDPEAQNAKVRHDDDLSTTTSMTSTTSTTSTTATTSTISTTSSPNPKTPYPMCDPKPYPYTLYAYLIKSCMLN